MSEFVVKITDSGGFTTEVKEHDGIYFPKFVPGNPAEHLTSIRNLSARDDDIILVTYPKAGTHWFWEMASMLLLGKAESRESMVPMEMKDADKTEALESPRLFSTHLLWRQLPTDFINKKRKIIHVMRNPKDIAVSNYHFAKTIKSGYEGTWDTYFPSYLEGNCIYGSWFDWVLDWEKTVRENPDYPILIIHYEDLKKDCAGELKKVSEFLGLECSDELLAAITEKCSFAVMSAAKLKADAKQLKFMSSKEGIHPMFRKGKVGDWKNTFTVAQNERFDNIYADKMKDSTYNLNYSVDQ